MSTLITSDTAFANSVFDASAGTSIAADSINLPIAVDLSLEGPSSDPVPPVEITGFVTGADGTKISLDYFFLNLNTGYQDGNIQTPYTGGNPFVAEGGQFLILVQSGSDAHLVASYKVYNENGGNFIDYHQTIAVLTGTQASSLTSANFNSVSESATYAPSVSSDASLLDAGGGSYTLGGSNSSLIGGNGDDDLSDNGGKGTLIGGSGNNVYHLSNSNSWVVDAGSSGEIYSSVSLDLASPRISGVNRLFYTGTTGGYLHGNDNDDDIQGGNGNDSVVTGLGNDSINGGSGNDSINAGSGNDTIIGGSGNDIIYGGAGEDLVSYATDTQNLAINLRTGIATGEGTDKLSGIEDVAGGSGADLITGDSLNNVVNGGAGNDTIIGGAGNDSIVGGTGEDLVNYATDTQNLSIDLGTGIATGDGTDTLSGIEDVTGGSGADTISGDSLNNVVNAGAGNDSINGGSGNDSILGGVGNDTINGGSGNDNIVGGTGEDLVSYATDTQNLSIDLGTGIATGDGTDTLSGIEDVTGGSGDDTISGDSLNNAVNAGSGNDSIIGGAGNDSILGGVGNDTINGGAGNDIIYGGVGEDLVSYATDTQNLTINLRTGIATGDGTDKLSGIEDIAGGSGADLITGDSLNNVINSGAGNDTIIGGAGNDSIVGGTGEDLVSYATDTQNLSIDLGTGIATGDGTDTLSGIEDVTGGSGADTISGDSLNNVVNAGAGNDSINGGSGNDSILGGVGKDTIIGGAGNDSIVGGTGEDLVSYETDTQNLAINLSTGIATGDGTDTLSGIEDVTGGSGDDLITGDSLNNVVNAGAGNDSINGGAGNDSILGGVGNDSILGGLGNDTILGSSAIANADASEKDTLTGGAGSDNFILGTSSAGVLYSGGGVGNYALITDFTVGTDQLQLSGAAGNYLLGSSGVAGVTGSGVFYDANSNHSLDSGDELIAILQSGNATALTAANTINVARFV